MSSPRHVLLVAVALACIANVATARYRDSGAGVTSFQTIRGHPGARNCTTHWVDQYMDHFSFGQPSSAAGSTINMTWRMKYLVYDKYYQPGGPIFFYAGNEAPITLFANIAGLMWQNAEKFNATLVFAEHRFFGESQPCADWADCRMHLSTMQAMADFALLMTNLTAPGERYSQSKGIITFGGSYGGMLSAWMRLKYPNLVTGSIASSGPIAMVSPAYERSSYWKVITNDASPFGGAAANCAYNVHAGIEAGFEMLRQAEGPRMLSQLMGSCTTFPVGEAGHHKFGRFIQEAFDLLGEGDYPFEIDFIFGTPSTPAPAWPMRQACSHLADNFTSKSSLLQALAAAVSVVYNVTQNRTCLDIDGNPTYLGAQWDYMICSEKIIHELPYFEAKGPPNDMFYPQPAWTEAMYRQRCMDSYGVTPRYGWLNTTYGAGNIGGATNIVFANGLLDPWHSGGILHNVSETVRSYIIPHGAHHLDLLFTSPSDPAEVHFVRSQEMVHVRQWLDALK